MLTTAVCDAYVEHGFPWLPQLLRGSLKSIAWEYIDRLSDIDRHSAPVLKTHDLFRPQVTRSAKYVFLFGDPLESAQSVAKMGREYGLEWIEEHIYHLASQGDPSSIFQSDVLNYEHQLRVWSEAEGVFCVHYEDLWERLSELSEYLGVEVVLPERRERARKSLPASYNRELFDRLRQLEREVRSKTS